jgi:hypothetical protein
MTDQLEDTDRARKERSPSFPFISLKKAVERLKEMAEAHRRSQARMVAVGATWGYAAKSSGLLQTVAALKAFGLIDDIGGGPDRKIQVSDLGWRILHDARPGALEAAIRESALKPRLIAEYAAQWVPERPSDAHCLSELQLDRGFNDVAAKLFLKVFDETITYANLKNGDNLSPVLDQEENAVEGAVEGPGPTSAAIRRVAAAMAAAEPQTVGTAPFNMNMGPDRIWGTFNLTCQEDAEEVIKRITALKAFLKPSMKEAAN